MIIEYSKDALSDIVSDFFRATGACLNIFNYDFERLKYDAIIPNEYCQLVHKIPNGMKACKKSDSELLYKCKNSKKTEIHVCHAGLIDIAIPILYDDEVIGYIVLGQMKKAPLFNEDIEILKDNSNKKNELISTYDSLPSFDDEKINSIIKIASILAKHILLEKMLKPKIDKNIEIATKYIKDNFKSKLTVSTIASKTNISKSTLYRIFNENFGCTVSDYINQLRIEKSISLLSETDLSVEEIAEKTGFASCSYFSRVFKKLYGVSPLKFKKENYTK